MFEKNASPDHGETLVVRGFGGPKAASLEDVFGAIARKGLCYVHGKECAVELAENLPIHLLIASPPHTSVDDTLRLLQSWQPKFFALETVGIARPGAVLNLCSSCSFVSQATQRDSFYRKERKGSSPGLLNNV